MAFSIRQTFRGCGVDKVFYNPEFFMNNFDVFFCGEFYLILFKTLVLVLCKKVNYIWRYFVQYNYIF
jgi:hypothetical protein